MKNVNRPLSRVSKELALRSDPGPTIETSALKTLYGGQFVLSAHLIKRNFPVSPTRPRIDAAPQFLEKLILSPPAPLT